ncbi:hypothetical protein B296_00058962 [Ensete ventricosum]|uniref:Uncharacterized protein n=1 Tax=Ensete ventricosum TaxID=4639 RepID=A0A426WYQ2_ENSVE|nr:hypothetical protein B296_00058962 [Ensete ventricosum]
MCDEIESCRTVLRVLETIGSESSVREAACGKGITTCKGGRPWPSPLQGRLGHGQGQPPTERADDDRSRPLANRDACRGDARGRGHLRRGNDNSCNNRAGSVRVFLWQKDDISPQNLRNS